MLVSHDERLIELVCKELWVVRDRMVTNLEGGLDEARIARVVGLASSVPFDRADPRAPTNRRISIVVLNRTPDAGMDALASAPANPATQAIATAPELVPPLAPPAPPASAPL